MLYIQFLTGVQEENNKQKQVHLTYISCLISGLFLNNANSQIFDALFLIVSIIHFSHDLPFKNRLIQILLSSIFVLDLEKIDFSFFIYYMIFIHVGVRIPTLALTNGLTD